MPASAGDDWEGAGVHKEKASEAKANGDHGTQRTRYMLMVLCIGLMYFCSTNFLLTHLIVILRAAAAVEAFTAALQCQSSALTFAARAESLLKLKRPTAAVADCNAALEINPDSGKALKVEHNQIQQCPLSFCGHQTKIMHTAPQVKGKALRFLGEWEEAHRTLAKAMAIDFDPDLAGEFVNPARAFSSSPFF